VKWELNAPSYHSSTQSEGPGPGVAKMADTIILGTLGANGNYLAFQRQRSRNTGLYLERL
jgi:hypothetical protein